MIENDPVGETARFGRALQVRRAQLGLKRRQLAERAFLSYPYISEIENGTKTPSTKALRQLAEALDLSPAELLARADVHATWPVERTPTARPVGPEPTHASSRATWSPAWPVGSGPPPTSMGLPPPSPSTAQGILERWTQEVVVAAIRVELATWARAELPALVRAEVHRVLAEGASETGGDVPHP